MSDNTCNDGGTRKVIQYLLLALLLAACVIESRDVIRRIAVEFHTRMDDFLIAGRAILNGYIPYQDHLDVKAPGAIFIGALSLLVTGDYRFEWALKIGMLLSFPILMMVLTYRGTRTQRRLLRWLLMASAFVMGSEFMLYTVARGGNNLNIAEPFGVFFALLYLLVVGWDREHMSRLRIGLASFFLLCTIGMKEPFLFTLLAMSMLIAKNMRSFVRSFIVPLGIALVAGTLILAFLGYLGAYLTVDIPTILFDRMTAQSSLALRSILSFHIFQDITGYSRIGPMMGYVILLLWIAHPVFKFNEKSKYLWLAAATIFAFSCSYNFSGMFWLLGQKFNFTFPVSHPLFQLFIAKYIASLVALVPLLLILFMSSRKLFRAVVLSGLALYLVTLAIGSGNFLSQHFLLAVPVYAGIFLLFVENPKFLLPIFLIALSPFFHPKFDYDKLIQNAESFRQSFEQYIPIAKAADDLMDRCSFKQYYALGSASTIAAFTKHSPTDLSYAQVSNSPELRKRYIERLQAAPVIFIDDDYLRSVKDEDIRTTLETYFTQEPPACVQDFAFTNRRMVMLFRKESEDPMATPPP